MTSDPSSLLSSRHSSAPSRTNEPELSMPGPVDRTHHEPPSASEAMKGQRDYVLTKSDHGIQGEFVHLLNTDSLQSDTKQTKTDTSKITSGTVVAEMATDSQKRLKTKSDENVSPFTSKQTHTDVTHLTKDQQLREEERFLLAKIHQMTRDRSSAADHHSMKLLIPDPRDIQCDTAGLFDYMEPRVFHSLDTIEEISLSEEEELEDELPQSQGEEKDV